MPKNLSLFETAILTWIKEHYDEPILTEQIDSISRVDRTYTGVGCYSKFCVSSNICFSDKDNTKMLKKGYIHGPDFTSAILKHGGGCILWLECKKVSQLEAFAYGDPFPEDHSDLDPVELEQN